MRIPLAAYIDESGQRASTSKSSDCFVMSAVAFPSKHQADASNLLAGLRRDLGRGRGDTLHWHNLKHHSQRVRAAQALAAKEWLTVSSVVACKRLFEPDQHLPDDDTSYLYTLRLLLERLSWFADDRGCTLHYTLAHVVRFKLAKLREYEAKLRALPGCQIRWNAIAGGGVIAQPNRVEYLQLADIAASATGAAFNPDPFGNTEQRYLRELSPRLYRRAHGKLTSYGLKMHPWGPRTEAAYPWVTSL